MTVSLSPSSLNLLKDCPRCFWLQFRKGIKRPNGIFPSLPNGMDKILKKHFDSFRDKSLLPPELSELKDVKLFDNVGLLEIWRDSRRGIQWADDEGNVLRGAVDSILQKGEKLIVLDFKTRGFPLNENTHEHYHDQMDIYNFLLRKNGFKTENYAYLLFYHPKEVGENGDVVFNTDLVKVNISAENGGKIFREAVEILKGEMPDCGEDCEFCRWRENE